MICLLERQIITFIDVSLQLLKLSVLYKSKEEIRSYNGIKFCVLIL